MNYITNSCYYIEQSYVAANGTTVWYNGSYTRAGGMKGKLYNSPVTNPDVSYDFRIVCVVATSCWSLMTFIVSA